MVDNLHASNRRELLTRLRELDVPVPPRGRGRTKLHVETYAIIRLLATLSVSALGFPLRLTKRERPDFLLEMPSGSVGIEHVEAIAPNAAHEVMLRNTRLGPDVYFPHPHRVGDPRNSRSELEERIASNGPAYPWIGDSVEVGWAEDMSLMLRRKVATARKGGFERFDVNWLLVYDNLTAPGLDHDVAMPKLLERLRSESPWPVFDHVFLLNESRLIDIPERGEPRTTSIPTLW